MVAKPVFRRVDTTFEVKGEEMATKKTKVVGVRLPVATIIQLESKYGGDVRHLIEAAVHAIDIGAIEYVDGEFRGVSTEAEEYDMSDVEAVMKRYHIATIQKTLDWLTEQALK